MLKLYMSSEVEDSDALDRCWDSCIKTELDVHNIWHGRYTCKTIPCFYLIFCMFSCDEYIYLAPSIMEILFPTQQKHVPSRRPLIVKVK